MNGDGVEDLAVGAGYDDDGQVNGGAVYILFLDTDGSVQSFAKIDQSTTNGPSGIETTNRYGSSIAVIDDLDGDGVDELAVGAELNDD